MIWAHSEFAQAKEALDAYAADAYDLPWSVYVSVIAAVCAVEDRGRVAEFACDMVTLAVEALEELSQPIACDEQGPNIGCQEHGGLDAAAPAQTTRSKKARHRRRRAA